MSDRLYQIINKEVISILSEKPKFKKIEYDIIFHNEVLDLPISIFESIELSGDFNNNIGDHIVVNVQMGGGDFAYDVFKYKDNIELTVNLKRDGVLYSSNTYKAILLNSTDNRNGPNANISKDILNKAELVRASFQVLEPTVELLRVIKATGIYKNMTMLDTVTAIFTNSCKSIKINGSPLNPTMNIVKPDNDTVYSHVIVPTGTRLIDVPTFLQDGKYGLYNGDIGVYIKNIRLDVNKTKLCVHVYPLYTTEEDMFDDLVIYHSDGKLNKSSDNTYNIGEDQLKIISNSLEILENKQNILMDKGGSITASNPDNLLMFNSDTSSENMSYDNEGQVYNQTLDTKDGLVNERYVGNEANMFKHKSQLFNDTMDLVKVTWKYSDASLLHPGMNVKLYYQIDDSVRVMRGVLQRHYTVYNGGTKLEETIMMLKLGDVNES